MEQVTQLIEARDRLKGKDIAQLTQAVAFALSELKQIQEMECCRVFKRSSQNTTPHGSRWTAVFYKLLFWLTYFSPLQTSDLIAELDALMSLSHISSLSRG